MALKNKRWDVARLLATLTIRRHVFGSGEEHPERQVLDVIPCMVSYLVQRPEPRITRVCPRKQQAPRRQMPRRIRREDARWTDSDETDSDGG